MTNVAKYSPVVFSGYYGMDNFGDDLFAYICASAAKKYWNQTEIRVLSPSIFGLSADYAIPELISRDLYGKPNAAGGFVRLLFALREAYINKLFILGGGSVINSQTSRVREMLYKSSGLTGIVFAALGISIGPFTSIAERDRARVFLSDFLFITVRDDASYQIAKEFELPCPVFHAGDLAGLMPVLLSHQQSINKSDEPVIGLSLCRYESIVKGDAELEIKRNKSLVSAVSSLAKKIGARVEVYSLNNHVSVGDDSISHEVCLQLAQAGIRYSLIRNVEHGVVEVWRRIANCHFFVSVRLHGAIAAYLNRVPFVLVEYHKKCSDFLDDVGQSNSLRIGGAISEPEIISKIILHLADEPKEPQLSVEKYTARSLKHFSFITNYLS